MDGIIPLKDKKGETVSEAFKTILKEGRIPEYLWVDKGKEYYNKHERLVREKQHTDVFYWEWGKVISLWKME